MNRKVRDRNSLGSVGVTSIVVPLKGIMDSGCEVILEHWNAVRGDRFAPSWREFDLLSLPGNLIRYTHVVDISTDPLDATFRFWGTGLTKVLYYDRTGQSMATANMGYLEEHRREKVLADHLRVAETREPMPFLWDATSYRRSPKRLVVPSIRLPLSNDNKTVTNVVTHFDFTSQKSEVWEEMFDVNNRIDESSPSY